MGLPNLFPFKAQVLESLARKKEQKETEAKLKKLKNKKDSDKLDVENAVSKSLLFEQQLIESNKDQDENDLNDVNVPKEKRKYMKELRKVLEASDVFYHKNIIFL